MMEHLGEKIQLFVITVILSAASLLMSKHQWRLRWLYFVVSVMFGTTVGVVATNTPMLHDWGHLLTAISAVMAPAILIWLRGKTLEEIVEDFHDMKEKVTKDGRE